MKNLLIRALSGAVYVALIVLAVFANLWITTLIFSILAALTTYEFHQNTNKLENVDVNPVAPAVATFVLLWIFASKVMPQCSIHFIIYIFFCLYFFISEIFKNKANPVNNLAYIFLGQVYTAVPFIFLTAIKVDGSSIFLLAFFIFIWANDTFAYLVGITFGKHKLCERISPKKSWEGFFGGLIGTLAVAFAVSYFAETQLNMTEWFGFAAIVVIFGILGDLLESLIKRSIGVKDSGAIMPGHGGLLDRFDSLLLAAPIICVYLLLFIN